LDVFFFNRTLKTRTPKALTRSDWLSILIMKHKDKHGNETPLKDLETSHLKNIIRWHNRIAEEGLTLRYGGGSCAEDIWYDEDVLYGKEALDHLKTSEYIAELSSR